MFLTLFLAIGIIAYSVDMNFFDLMITASNAKELVHLLMRCVEVIEGLDFVFDSPDWRARLRATQASLESEQSRVMAEKRRDGRRVALAVLGHNSMREHRDEYRPEFSDSRGLLRMLDQAISLVVQIRSADDPTGLLTQKTLLEKVQADIEDRCLIWELHDPWGTFATNWPSSNVSIGPHQGTGSRETYSSGSCCC